MSGPKLFIFDRLKQASVEDLESLSSVADEFKKVSLANRVSVLNQYPYRIDFSEVTNFLRFLEAFPTFFIGTDDTEQRKILWEVKESAVKSLGYLKRLPSLFEGMTFEQKSDTLHNLQALQAEVLDDIAPSLEDLLRMEVSG